MSSMKYPPVTSNKLAYFKRGKPDDWHGGGAQKETPGKKQVPPTFGLLPIGQMPWMQPASRIESRENLPASLFAE